MDKIKEVLDELGFEPSLTLEEIPRIDLYMDQVIQLFENKFGETKRNDDEKILTKTMINNYAKGKLIFPIKNKKYSREHLILMSLIYQLKGALSINDIKQTLEGLNKRVVNGNVDLESFYSSYLHLMERNIGEFKSILNEQVETIDEEVSTLKDEDSDYLEQVLMISSLVHMSNLYRKVAEKLVDDLAVEIEEKRHR